MTRLRPTRPRSPSGSPGPASTIDSASLGGPGGFGAYQLSLGRLGGKGGLSPGNQVRVTLFENGIEVGHVFVVVPPASGGATLLMTAADLAGQDPAPSAHRVLRGTVTQLVPFAPGGDPAGGRVPFAGAVVTVGSARQGIQTTVDAQGRYIFTNLTCSPCQVAVATAAGQQLAQASVTLQQPDPSTTVRDFTVGNPPDQLFVTGRVVPPFVFPGDPPPADPATLAIRVTGPGFTIDSASLGGPGGFGAYQLSLGRLGGKGGLSPGNQVRVTLFENGIEVGHVFVVVPPASGGATLLMTAADLAGQ